MLETGALAHRDQQGGIEGMDRSAGILGAGGYHRIDDHRPRPKLNPERSQGALMIVTFVSRLGPSGYFVRGLHVNSTPQRKSATKVLTLKFTLKISFPLAESIN